MLESKYKSIAIGTGIALVLMVGAFIVLAGIFIWREASREDPVKAATVGSPSPSPTPLSIPDLVRNIKPSVVAITTYDSENKKTGLGSGFFITPTQVVSNWHVIADSFKAEAKTTTGKTYAVKGTVAFDKESDLALLQIDIPASTIMPLPLAANPPTEGERVVAIGNPVGLEGSVSDGIVSGIRDIPELGRMLQISAPVSPGSSGGPVVNMMGEVVGVTRGALEAGQNLNFAVLAEKVSALKAGKLKTLPELVRGDAEKFSKDAQALIEKRDYTSAIEQAAKATGKDPTFEMAWFQQGQCAVELGNYKDALAAFQRVTQINPKSYEAYNNIGAINNRLQIWDDAIVSLKKAEAISPQKAEVHLNLAEAECNSGQTQAAGAEYRKLLLLNRSKAATFFNDYSSCLESAGITNGPDDAATQ
jgi:S1-C subfamily serine protease